MKIGEMYSLKKGKKPGEIFAESSPSMVRFIQIEDLRHNNSLKFCEKSEGFVYCDKDDIVIAWDGANAGTVGWGLEGAVGSTLAVLTPKDKKKFFSPFVARYLSSKQEYLREMRTGATIPHLQKDSLLNLDLPDLNLEAQKELSKKFEIIDVISHKGKLVLDALDELVESYFIHTFILPENNWPEVLVEDLAANVSVAMRSGPFGSDLKHSEFVSEGVAVLGIDNVATNEFRWGERRFITLEKYEELKRYTVRPGDVLITIMATLGRTCVVPDDIPLSINTKHLAALTLDKTKVLPEFLSKAFLLHPEILRQLKVSEKGAIMAGLNLGIIKNIKIKLPPLGLQEKFVEFLKIVKKIRNQKKDSISSVSELQAALISQTFE